MFCIYRSIVVEENKKYTKLVFNILCAQMTHVFDLGSVVVIIGYLEITSYLAHMTFV